jgi:hypothetical protein
MKTRIINIALGILLGFVMLGCSQVDESNIPTNTEIVKTEPNWVRLPEPSDPSFKKVFTVSKEIDGSKGGNLRINQSYTCPTGLISVYADLVKNNYHDCG